MYCLALKTYSAKFCNSPQKLWILGSTGTVIYEGTYDDGSIETHELVISDTVADLSENIASATTYDFSVKLVADKMETLTSAGFYETIEMESNEATVKCYTNPAQLSGMYWFYHLNSMNKNCPILKTVLN